MSTSRLGLVATFLLFHDVLRLIMVTTSHTLYLRVNLLISIFHQSHETK
jgi:hypothetical protein